MNEVEINEFRMQHIDSYRNAVIEIVKNNTFVLVDQDITSLLRKPPLDSMDVIKSKFLSLAKRNKTILNTEELSKILDNYRNFLLDCCGDIKNIRINELTNIVKNIKFEKSNDIIKINKKDFNNINKKIKKILKDRLESGVDSCILKNVDSVFSSDLDEEIKKKIILDVTKYIKSNYKNQVLENFDIKILVKDTTLMNSSKEQADRYLFTLNNSRLLNDES